MKINLCQIAFRGCRVVEVFGIDNVQFDIVELLEKLDDNEYTNPKQKQAKKCQKCQKFTTL